MTIKTMTSKFGYRVAIEYDSRDKIYVARVPKLENCHSHGDTPEAALANVEEAIELWLETAKEAGIPIPRPQTRASKINT